MTWLEKYRADHPELTDLEIIALHCPPDTDTDGKCPPDIVVDVIAPESACVECWYRKMPEEDGA